MDKRKIALKTPLSYSKDNKITELLIKYGAKNTYYNYGNYISKGINFNLNLIINKMKYVYQQFL